MIKWACPKCGAPAGDHGRGGTDACKADYKIILGLSTGLAFVLALPEMAVRVVSVAAFVVGVFATVKALW